MSETTQQETKFQKPVKQSAKGGAAKWLVTVIIVVVIVLGGLYLVSRYSNFNVLGLSKTTSSEWQAVFLTNGQVYFGTVEKSTKEELVVNNIYYLQVTQPLQRSADEAADPNQQNELALVKLGNELHGPTDLMRINKDHILFIENLKEDSKVVEAIEQSREVN